MATKPCRTPLGSANTGIGYEALRNNGGNANTALGYHSLYDNKGDENIAIGVSAYAGKRIRIIQYRPGQ